MSVEATLRRVLETVLKQSFPTGEDVCRSRVPQWDSLKHVEVLFAVEDAFDIRLSEEEMAQADSLSALAALVETHHAS